MIKVTHKSFPGVLNSQILFFLIVLSVYSDKETVSWQQTQILRSHYLQNLLILLDEYSSTHLYPSFLPAAGGMVLGRRMSFFFWDI